MFNPIINVDKIDSFLKKINPLKLIFIGVLTNLFLTIFFNILSNSITNEPLTKGFKDLGSVWNQFLIAVIFAPIFETVLFQYAIIETIRKRLKPLFSCIVSAFIFASMHLYNIFYFFFAFFIGLLFGYLYYLGVTIKKGFIIVMFTHMVYNFIILILKFFSN